jgi:hypothetical protein
MARLLLALAASLAACASSTPVLKLGLPDDTEPVEAVIHGVDWRGVTFEVNQPAHVAVFEIVPGRGVSLMYPQYASQTNFVRAGFYTTPHGLNSGRLQYQTANPWERYPDPRYYLLVASRYPLALGQMLSSAGAVRSALGWQRFTDRNVYSTMELLSRAIVPAYDSDLQADSWTSDVYVVWPSHQRYSSFSEYRNFQCADGRVFLVPWQTLPASCFDRLASRPSRPTGQPIGSDPAPSSPDATLMPDTGSKGRTTEPRLPAGTPAGRFPDGLVPPRPGHVEVDHRIAEADDGDARAPRRTGRVAFDNDPRMESEQFRSRGRARLSGERTSADEGLRAVRKSDAQRRFGSAPRSQPRARGESSSGGSRAERAVEPRSQPRSEPKSAPRSEPRSEPRSRPRPEPRSEPRSKPRPSGG